MPIELFHWEYRPPLIKAPLVGRIRRRRPVPNFGDEIGPLVVRAIVEERGLPRPEAVKSNARLLSVGSVLHFAEPGDHVWGTGINAKRPPEFADAGSITFHAVRGPRTAAKLSELGYEVPPVFGDPALLIERVPAFRQFASAEKTRKLAVIPNFNDLARYRKHPDYVSPLQSPLDVARVISQSEFVVGSSLHAMVFADALGVPARLIASENEHPFKYEDYYLGSGREPQRPASSVEEAHRLGPVDPLLWDPTPLLEAFPESLFRG